ncbi:MAG: NTP transferase domain-containing protein [Verrucomicrobiota bacterium]
MSAPSTLIILAAGMGSRFGGPKQMMGVGPSGETLLEYGLYDAQAAGFTKFVFVIREEIREDFEANIIGRFEDRLNASCVLQSTADLPEGVDSELGSTREKPWGTAHAVWSARDCVEGACGVMNADDFYGKESFRILWEALNLGAPGCLVPFALEQTLSSRGGVSRGVCHMDIREKLLRIQECRDLELSENGQVEGRDNTTLETVSLDRQTPVSMNLMGFGPEIWTFLDRDIRCFFGELPKGDSKREYGLPDLLSAWMSECEIQVRASPETWFGMTHPSDLEAVRLEIEARVVAGDYPSNLWSYWIER